MKISRILAFLDFLRRVDGLTQKDVADLTKLSRSHVSEIYAGKKGIRLPILMKFAELHKVECWEIIYFAETLFCDFNRPQIKAKVSQKFYALMCVFYQQQDE